MRQQPIAQSVPAVTASSVEATAITKLWPMLPSQVPLVNRLAKCRNEIASCGSDR